MGEGCQVAGWCDECGPTTLVIEGRRVSCEQCGSGIDYIEETPSERAERRLNDRLDNKTTVGELIAQLEQFDGDTPVTVTAGGAWNWAAATVEPAMVAGRTVADITEEGADWVDAPGHGGPGENDHDEAGANGAAARGGGVDGGEVGQGGLAREGELERSNTNGNDEGTR